MVCVPYIYHKFMANVGKYPSPMDPVGKSINPTIPPFGTRQLNMPAWRYTRERVAWNNLRG